MISYHRGEQGLMSAARMRGAHWNQRGDRGQPTPPFTSHKVCPEGHKAIPRKDQEALPMEEWYEEITR